MPDAIVIGSGPNGLAAAVRLAEAGRQVLVLEGAEHYGGAVRSEALTLDGFVHDTFSSVYPAGAASPVFGRMPLQRHGLEWVHPQACYAHPFDDGRAAVLDREVETTAAALDDLQPGDGARWAAFAGAYVDAFEGVRDTMLSGFPPLSGPLRLLAQGGPLKLAEFARLLPTSATSLGRRLFDSSLSRVWLHGSAMHTDAPPDRPGSAIASFYLNVLGHAVGWPSPRGGAGRLADALVGYLSVLGATVRTGAPVTRITSAGGRVTGVEVADGTRADAPVVIADVMPHALVALAGHAFSAGYRTALERYRYGAATVKVDWALDGPIPWTAEAVRRAGTVHVGGDEAGVLAAVATARTGLPDQPFMLLGQQSIADPTRAPAGRHTAWAYTHGPQHGIDWGVETDRHVARMEAQVERFAPGFRDRILARHVLSPRDLERRNPNLVGGDVGGGSYALRQLVFRPIPRWSPYRTPLAGLFLGSAATFPGGAVHGVPGDAAARAALRDDHTRAWPIRRATSAASRA